MMIGFVAIVLIGGANAIGRRGKPDKPTKPSKSRGSSEPPKAVRATKSPTR